MISQEQALVQLERIMGMVGFPKGRESGTSIAEYRRAMETSRTPEIAARVVDDILREFKRSPAVSDIWEMVSEENNRDASTESEPRCSACDGTGAEVVYLLVTYAGRSLEIRRRQILAGFDNEKAQEFGARLRWDDGPVSLENPFMGDNQQILTGARPCKACGRAA